MRRSTTCSSRSTRRGSAQTCARASALLARRADAPAAAASPLWDEALGQLRSLLSQPGLGGAATGGTPPLRVIQAGVGNTIQLVPVDEVVFFEAADKYVRVLTADRELLIRTALRELLPQLDTTRFWQVHRGTVVRADAIAAALRDEVGKITLTLRGRPERLHVSRLYAPLFRAM